MEQNDITISARDVAMRFRLTDDKILSLKEFVTRKDQDQRVLGSEGRQLRRA